MEYIKPILEKKDFLNEDILSANPIGSTEFTFVGDDSDTAFTESNVSQHPKYHRAKFNDYLTDPGKFFKDNDFHDKTSPHSENNLPDRCFLNNDGEVVCSFNDRLQNIPPKLIMDDKYNGVLDTIGKLNNKSSQLKDDDILFENVKGSFEKNNENNLNIENLPKNVKYTF